MGLAEWLRNHLVGADGTCHDHRRTLRRPWGQKHGFAFGSCGGANLQADREKPQHRHFVLGHNPFILNVCDATWLIANGEFPYQYHGVFHAAALRSLVGGHHIGSHRIHPSTLPERA